MLVGIQYICAIRLGTYMLAYFRYLYGYILIGTPGSLSHRMLSNLNTRRHWCESNVAWHSVARAFPRVFWQTFFAAIFVSHFSVASLARFNLAPVASRQNIRLHNSYFELLNVNIIYSLWACRLILYVCVVSGELFVATDWSKSPEISRELYIISGDLGESWCRRGFL